VNDELLAIAQFHRLNLLVVGSSSEMTDLLIQQLTPEFQTPICICVFPGPLLLPDDDAGTLVLRGVDAIDGDQQQQLLTWLDDNAGRTQVVSVASHDIFAGVERGTFAAGLYYRLNTVMELIDEKEGTVPLQSGMWRSSRAATVESRAIASSQNIRSISIPSP
jgi:hypothetical protein